MQVTNLIIKVFTIGIVSNLLLGCSMFNIPQPGDPAFAPVPPERMKAPNNHSGAIYQAGFSDHLFEDRTAHRVGDVITVVLTEQTNSQKIANTNIKKESDMQLESPTILGASPTFGIPGIVPMSSNKNNNLAVNYDASREFIGQSNSQQNNRLSGTITVTVADILPNGNLAIRGEKWIKLNQGEEYIRLTGIVRPEDLTSNNTVLSTQLADARIAYSGTGQSADANAMGWLARFFSSVFFLF